MKASQMNACLVLFLVAVGLQGSYGENGMGENCTSSSDCDYSHGRCAKYDQCEMGTCDCDYGYRVSEKFDEGYLCQKLKRIGDRCDVVEDQCYDGTCQGVCTCGRDRHASEDREECLGNSYDEPCDTKNFANSNWKRGTCESSKGLTCDGDTSKCRCDYGKKLNGDHCELYKISETCDAAAAKPSDRKLCESHLSCIEKKCACSETTKEHTFLIRENGVETERKRCVDKEAKLNLAESAGCIADYRNRYNEDKANVCGNYLLCGTCIEWANEYRNNTKCVSGGADSLRTNAVASLSLMLVAFFVMRH